MAGAVSVVPGFSSRFAGVVLGAALLCSGHGFSQASQPQLAAGSVKTAGAASRTELTVSTDDQGSRTRATFTVHVSAADRSATPTGTVTLMLGKASVGSAVLDAAGDATTSADALPRGTDQIQAVYNGDASFAGSASAETTVRSQATGVPDFTITADPSSLSLSPGDYGTTTLSITPENGFNDAVTLSCLGQPAATTCVFSPVSATPNGTSPAVSTLTIQTRSASNTRLVPLAGQGGGLAYALLLPGIGGVLVFGMRRKSSGLRNLAIAGLLLAGTAGLTACSQRYDYLHYPPISNPGTPAGTFKIQVTGFSNNGSTVTTHTLKYITLTVK